MWFSLLAVFPFLIAVGIMIHRNSSSVSTPLYNQECNKVIIVFPHFKSFKLVGYTNEQNKEIDLIIGTDCYHKFFTNGKEGEPVAQKAYFWCILNRNISTLVFKNPSFVTSLQINTFPVLNLSTEFRNEIFEN